MKMGNVSARDGASEYVKLIARALFALLLWCMASSAYGAPIYKCVDADGGLAFRDTPCTAHAQQTKLEIAGLPLIDHGAPRFAAAAHASTTGRSRNRRATAVAHKQKPPTSWECRAVDGEVFYRHTRCPGSVPGDGGVRSHYVEKTSSVRAHGHHNAWSRVRVHGVKVSRTEACRRIHSAAAAGRDGRQRDDTVSTYDHLMGRDPCSV